MLTAVALAVGDVGGVGGAVAAEIERPGTNNSHTMARQTVQTSSEDLCRRSQRMPGVVTPFEDLDIITQRLPA